MDTIFNFEVEGDTILVQVSEGGILVWPTNGDWFGPIWECPHDAWDYLEDKNHKRKELWMGSGPGEE